MSVVCCRITALLVMVLIAPTGAAAGQIVVDELRLETRADGATASARLGVELTPPVTEALAHGVPISFDWTLRVVDGGVFGLARTLWEATGRLRLDYRPLSRRYSLTDGNAGTQQSFPDLRRLLEALQRFRQPLPPLTTVLADAAEPRLRFRVRLAIGALPPALRLPSYLDEAWRLDSGWIERSLP